MKQLLRPLFSRDGFSLIEVTMAIGVVAVALTSMMALVPTGLTILRDSRESTARTDILRKVSAELQQTPFRQISSQTQMRYFGESGEEISAGTEAVYGMRYEVAPATRLVTGGADGAYDNNYLRPVRVEIFTRADLKRLPMEASFATTLFVPQRGM